MGATAEVFKIVGQISLKNVDNTFKQLDAFEKAASEVTKGLGKMARALDHAGLQLSRAFTAPLAAAGAAIGALALKTGDYADKILTLEQQTGLSTDTLQEFAHVAKAAGGSSDALFATITALTGKLPDIAAGTGETAEALGKLGIRVQDADGKYRSMNDIFPEIITALQKEQDQTKRNVLTYQIFGKASKEVTAFLGMTSREMSNLRAEARSLGSVMSKDSLTAANNFRISIDNLKERFTALGRDVAMTFMPVFQESLLPLIENDIIPAIRAAVDVLKSFGKAFMSLPPWLKSVVTDLVAFVGVLGPALLLGGKFVAWGKGLIPVVVGIINVFKIARAEVIAFSEALNLASGPVGLIVAGITGAVVLAIELHRVLSKANKEKEKLEKQKKEESDYLAYMEKRAKSEENMLKEQVENYEKLSEKSKKNPFFVDMLTRAKESAEEALVEFQNLKDEMDGNKTNAKQQRYDVEEMIKRTGYNKLAIKSVQELAAAEEAEAAAVKNAAEEAARLAKQRKGALAALVKTHADAMEEMGKSEAELLELKKKRELEEVDALASGETEKRKARLAVTEHFDAMQRELQDKEAEEWKQRFLEQSGDELEILKDKYDKEIAAAKGNGEKIAKINEYYANDRNKIREDAEKEWAGKLQEQAGNRRAILEKERDDTIAALRKKGADVTATEKYYANELANIQKAANKPWIEALRQQVYARKKAQAEASGDAIKILEAELAERRDKLRNGLKDDLAAVENSEADKARIKEYYAEEETRLAEEGARRRTDIRKREMEQAAAFVSNSVNKIGSLFSSLSSQEEKRVDKDDKERKAAIEANVKDEAQRAKALESLDAEVEARKLEIQREQAKRNKALGVFNTVINTAQAVVKALSDPGGIAGIVMAGLVGALGAAELAVIVSEPEPFEAGAMIQGGRGGVRGLVGEGRQDELILPLETGTQRLADDLIARMGGGGETVNNVHYTVNVNAGTLVADDYSAKQFARKINAFIVADNVRRGIT
jgi:hypothetical protein